LPALVPEGLHSSLRLTLIELVLVLAIIGIAAAVGIPSFLRARREAQLDNRTRELV
jgi:prepilin-type N-terminal cleavage/methylation domain-containing protein